MTTNAATSSGVVKRFVASPPMLAMTCGVRVEAGGSSDGLAHAVFAEPQIRADWPRRYRVDADAA